MQTSAVIDRIEGVWTVLLVGEGEREMHMHCDQMPPNCQPGHWLTVTVEGADITHVELDPQATEKARSRIRSKLNKLRKRGSKAGTEL